MNNRFLFLLMILGIIGTGHSVRTSGDGMYTEGDHSLIGNTRAAITRNNDGEFEEIDGEFKEIDNEPTDEHENSDNEEDVCETPLYRQSNTKHQPPRLVSTYF